MSHPSGILPVRPETLVAHLHVTFTEWAHPHPLVDALVATERLTRRVGGTLGDVAGMPWFRYRSYLVALDVARREFAGCRWLPDGPSDALSQLAAASRNAGGIVHAGLDTWQAQMIAAHPHLAAEYAAVTGRIRAGFDEAFETLPMLDPAIDPTIART